MEEPETKDTEAETGTDAVELTPLEALVEISGLQQEEDESAGDYSQRMYEHVKGVSETEWEKLGDLNQDAAAWHNDYHAAVSDGKKKLPLIPGLEAPKKAGRAARTSTSRKGAPSGRAAARNAEAAGSFHIRTMVMKDPEMSAADIYTAVADKGVKVTESTCSTTRASFLRTFDFLRNQGVIDEDALMKISPKWKKVEAVAAKEADKEKDEEKQTAPRSGRRRAAAADD